MANTFDGSGSIDQITAAWEKLTKAVGESVAVLENYKKAAKLPSQYVAELEKVKKANEQIKNSFLNLSNAQNQYKANLREEKRLQKSLADTKAKAAKVDSEVSKAQIKHNEALKQRRKLLREEARLTNTATSVYDKIQAKVNVLTREYNNLAAKQELGIKLRDKEIQRLEWAEKKLNGYQTVLKSVDKRIGRHTRNVGNYASAYDGLGWSIAQITREAPAFTHNLTTGFMAISNNIPMLVDEINKLRQANQLLIAQGEPTVNVFQRVMKAFFGWQTLISLGIVLLTMYGKEMTQFIAGMFKGADATGAMKENMKKLNEETASLAGQTIPKFIALVKISRDLTKSEQERTDALTALNDEYPDFNANILDEESATAAVNKEIASYIENLTKKARAQAAMNMLQEKFTELLNLERETREAFKRAGQDVTDSSQYEEALKRAKEQADLRNRAYTQAASASRGADVGIKNITTSMEAQAAKQEEINELMDIYVDNVDIVTTKTAASAKEQEEFATNSLKAFEKNINALKELQSNVEIGSESWEFYKNMINLLTAAMEKLEKGFTSVNEGIEAQDSNIEDLIDNKDDLIDKMKDELKLQAQMKEMMGQLRAETDRWIQSFSSDVFRNSGLNTLETLFNGTFEALIEGADNWKEKFAVTFNTATEIAQEAFNLIDQFGQVAFQNELIRAEQSRDISLQFAGDSAAARAEIQEQYERRRRDIQTRQAQAEKRNAMFNIAIDTAQGIVSALASTPPNVPLSVTIAGIGAAQLALVSSQKIPQFAEGTRDFGGGLAVVGDGGRAEIVTTPKGDVYKTPSKDTLVNLPKGANVYSSEQEYQNELNNILSSNGILQSSPIVMVSPKQDNKLYDKLDSLEKTVKNKSGLIINLDENGFKKSIAKGNTRTNILNNRVSFRGSQV